MLWRGRLFPPGAPRPAARRSHPPPPPPPPAVARPPRARRRGSRPRMTPADDFCRNVVGPPLLRAAVAQDRHDGAAPARAEPSPPAAAQAAAADPHRRDHVQLRADRDRWIAL